MDLSTIVVAVVVTQWAGDAVTLSQFDIDEPEFELTASSTLREPKLTRSYAPAQAMDGKLSTSWCEGRAGHGEAEWLTIRFKIPWRIKALRIWPGCGEKPTTYQSNNRIASATVLAGDVTGQLLKKVELKDEQRFHDLGIETAKPVGALTISIDRVYPGSRYDDTCVSEVELEFNVDRDDAPTK